MKKLTRTHKSLFLRMLSILLTCIAVISVSPSGAFGQAVEKKITIDFKNTSVRQIIYELRKQSGMNFMFEDSQIDKMAPRTLQLKNVSVEKALDELLKDTGYTYKITGNSVAIVRKVEDKQVEGPTVSGVVTDKNGEPLVGVTIVIKGTYRGTTTNIDGKYSLAGIPADATLIFTFIGMDSQEVAINGRPEIDVQMVETSTEIEGVVVTGYQSISREKVTGATSTVTSRQLEERYTPNILDNLEGRVAGFMTYDGKTTIRGTSSMYAETSPLLVVDGLPVEGKIEDLNPYDIESVTVLKDAAAAAIYGARASNGIIVITTKKAKKIGVTEIDFSGNLTIYEKRNLDYSDNFYMEPDQQVDKESEYYEYYFFNNPDSPDPIGTFESNLNK